MNLRQHMAAKELTCFSQLKFRSTRFFFMDDSSNRAQFKVYPSTLLSCSEVTASLTMVQKETKQSNGVIPTLATCCHHGTFSSLSVAVTQP